LPQSLLQTADVQPMLQASGQQEVCESLQARVRLESGAFRRVTDAIPAVGAASVGDDQVTGLVAKRKYGGCCAQGALIDRLCA